MGAIYLIQNRGHMLKTVIIRMAKVQATFEIPWPKYL